MRTLARWTAAYEAHGLNGLGRRRPANAGRPRIVVSRPFDTAFRQAGHAPELLAQIGAKVDQAAKALWASRAEIAGWAAIRRDVEFILLETCEALGVTVPEAALRLSRRHIERFAQFRIVNTFRNDRKAYDDAKPRIRRAWTHMDPMRCVVADVKHVDVIVTRPDGRQAWPKVVGFYDAGTARFFLHPVLCPERESIRQEHVVEAFLAMCEAPGWGVPRQLYLDNGSEFAAFEMLRSHLAVLAGPDDSRPIIYAKAYNAAAKPIEPGFARLDRYVFSKMEGHVGGDRMVKKTQTVGKPPKPYPHSWDHFCETLAVLVADFHDKPMGGQWQDRSPAQMACREGRRRLGSDHGRPAGSGLGVPPRRGAPLPPGGGADRREAVPRPRSPGRGRHRQDRHALAARRPAAVPERRRRLAVSGGRPRLPGRMDGWRARSREAPEGARPPGQGAR